MSIAYSHLYAVPCIMTFTPGYGELVSVKLFFVTHSVSLLSILSNRCSSLTVTYDISISASCSVSIVNLGGW